jgi:hypothetical protein
MEVFMVEQEITPVWIGGKVPLFAMAGAPTVLPREKKQQFPTRIAISR